MTDSGKARKVSAAVEQIRGFQERSGEPPRRRTPWRLDVPVWQLAVEGVAAFVIAFVSGLGLGVLYQVMANV